MTASRSGKRSGGGSSPFDAEWRDCQREHYQHLVRHGSRQQRAAAAQSMLVAGFTEAELSALYVQATLHVDDLPDDFVPDLDALETERQQRDLQPHPDECMCPSCRGPEPGPDDAGSR